MRSRSAEALVFSVAAALALVHAFDDAFLLPGTGVPVGQHALAAAIALVATVAALVGFPSLRPGLRAATAFTFGALAVVNGGRHAHHIINEGVTSNDVTGAVALVAGVVLVGLAAWIPFRHRGEGLATPVRRWAIRALILPAAVVSLYFFFGPVDMAIVDIHSLHRPIAARRAPPTRRSPSRPPTASASRAGTAPHATAPPCS